MVTSMAKKENNDKILEYLKSHSQATEDEIAKDLNINVVEVLDSLITFIFRSLAISSSVALDGFSGIPVFCRCFLFLPCLVTIIEVLLVCLFLCAWSGFGEHPAASTSFIFCQHYLYTEFASVFVHYWP